MQLWEAQKIKQVSDPPVISQLRLTAHPNIQASWQDEDDVMLSAHRPSFILTQERRSSCHFECQVRPQMKIFAKVVDASPSFVSVFYTENHFFASCRLCTIWNTDCKSHMKTIHFNCAFHRTWLGCADIHLHSHIWGWMKWDFGLILPQNKLLFPGLI